MSDAVTFHSRDTDWSIRVPMTTDERLRTEEYLASTDRVAGRWVRTLMLRALADAEALEAGKTQVDMVALRGEERVL
jgi:hypothetical protein